MKNNNALFSSNSDDWKTPLFLYESFMCRGYIDTFKFKSDQDELKNDYYGKKLFVNPPYSKLDIVCDWLIRQINNNNLICLLIPARTDTKYFHKLLTYHPKIYFFKGRLKFNDKGCAPFPSILMVFNNYKCCVYSVIDGLDYESEFRE